MYYLQLCVGDEFLFPLAKPSRSFQNLTEKSALIILLLSKGRKMATKMKIVVKTPLHPLTNNKTGVYKGITYSSYIGSKT